MNSAKKLFDECLAEIPAEVKQEISISFAIANRIDELLKEQHLTQKEFAKQIGKTPAEVSRWLSGTHNFTLKTIALISNALHCDIVKVI